MMEKNPCFCIEDVCLYLEQVLVEFEAKPIFYVCRDLKGNRYVILCADLEEERYIIVKPSMKAISHMLHGKLAMRDLIMEEKYFWEVIAREGLNDDTVCKKDIMLLPLQDLPDEGAYFQIASKEIEQFTQGLDDKMLEDGLWDAMHCGVSIDIINCQYWDVHTSAEEFSFRIQKYIQLYERKVRIMQMDYTDGYEIEDVTETELSYAA